MLLIGILIDAEAGDDSNVRSSAVIHNIFRLMLWTFLEWTPVLIVWMRLRRELGMDWWLSGRKRISVHSLILTVNLVVLFLQALQFRTSNQANVTRHERVN